MCERYANGFLRNIGAGHTGHTGFAAGLGIHTSVFQVICSFFVSKSAKERFTCEKEWICSSCHFFVTRDLSEWLFCFVKSHRSKALKLLFKKEIMSEEQGWKFAHSHIAHSLICSFRSRQMSDCERFAQVAQDKWVTVSESLRSLMTNERLWAICSGHLW